MQWSIIQLGLFASEWKRLRLKDEDLRVLELMLMQHPGGGDVMSGTGGLRKVRFAPPSWYTGKSGAARVVYAVLESKRWLCLFMVFGKNQQANLSADEKAICRKLMREIGQSVQEARP